MEKETFIYTSHFLNEAGESKLRAFLAEFWDGEMTDRLVDSYKQDTNDSADNHGSDCAGIEIPAHNSKRKRAEPLSFVASDFDVETTQKTL